MVTNTHTMTLGRSKNKIIQIVRTSFAPKTYYLISCGNNKTCRDCIRANSL